MSSILDKMRQKILQRDYYLSSHAEDEMVEDGFNRQDVENAILNGKIEKRMTKDPRGPRFRLEGPAQDGSMMHVICRLDGDKSLRIITVYAIGEE